MSPDTGSGTVLEHTILPALERKGYNHKSQFYLAELGLAGRRHRLDVLVERDDGKLIPISLKYQGVGGTTDEKLPYEIIKLIHLVETGEGKYPYAYIIIAGPGFNKLLRAFYLSGELARYIRGYELVKIITLDDFLELANRKKL